MEDRLKAIFENVNEWLKFAEAKNGIAVALLGAALIGIAQTLSGGHPPQCLITWYLLYNTIPFFVAALVISLVSFLPQTKLKWLERLDEPKDYDNLLFYGHIAKYGTNDFLTALNKRYGHLKETPEVGAGMDRDYAEQIITNSRITLRKFNLFNIAAKLLIAGVISPLGSLLYWLFVQDKS